MLSAVEAEMLGDDPVLREHLIELAADLSRWDTAGAQAVCVHLRLAAEPHDGYVPADLDAALNDYRFARGLVQARVRTITDHLHQPEE